MIYLPFPQKFGHIPEISHGETAFRRGQEAPTPEVERAQSELVVAIHGEMR